MIEWPAGFRIEQLTRDHSRNEFDSNEPRVNSWLATQALQNQTKHLSVTRVLLSQDDAIAGYYTLAMGQIDFTDLPAPIAKRLPRRALPVAILAWMGIHKTHQGTGLGRLLLAQSLRDCYDASATFPFVAVVLDCINESVKAFYARFEFDTFPDDQRRMFLPFSKLEAMMRV